MGAARIHVYVAGASGEIAEERDAIVSAVLACGHWPGGPGQSGEPARASAIVQPWLRQADAMVLVLAASDGGPAPDGAQSLIEWELDEASALGLPVITVALADRMLAAHKRQILGPGARERFTQLRQAAIDDGVPVVDGVDALRGAIVLGLARLVGRDVVGWIREDEAMVRARVVDELARLSAENAALRRLQAADAPPVPAREVLGLSVERWQAILQGRTIRDLRTRQPLTLERALLDHAAAFALGVAVGDKPAPLEHWLFHEVGGPLASLGLVDAGDPPTLLRLRADARPLIAALELLQAGGRGEETVVATSDSALRARIAGEVTRGRAEEEKTNFWTVEGPAPPRRPK